MAKKSKSRGPEFRMFTTDIRYTEAQNAAKRKGISMAAMLRPVIYEFLDELPDHYKQEYNPF